MLTRDGALDFTMEEINMWSSLTQAISILSDAHFDLFNEMESESHSKRAQKNYLKGLGTLYHAAAYLRATAPQTAAAYDSRFFKLPSL